MSLKYAFFHWFVHISIAFILANLVASNQFEFFSVFLFTFLIDVDHLPLIKKFGIIGAFRLRAVTEFKKPRKFFLHNFYLVAFLPLLTLIFFYFKFFAWKLILAILLHLFWDLFEDAIIFKMGIKHWK